MRARPGTSRMGGTLPRGDRSVLRPRLNWEGGAAWNTQNWYHAGSSELGLKETVMLTTPRPRGQGKRRMERGGGIAKRPRMESSSSERRDESEESRSGGTRDRTGRGGRRAARPMTPPHRPPPPSISPRRSPRLTRSAARDLRNLPRAAKTDRRTAHSRSVIGDEHGRGPSRSSQSSSDHGESSQGRRSRSREPTPPQLMNFSIDDFTVVSHTMDSFTFTSAHPFFPGWVRVVGAHREDRVRNTPCAHNPEEDQQAKRRVRRDLEPSELQRFLRQELLKQGVPEDKGGTSGGSDFGTGDGPA